MDGNCGLQLDEVQIRIQALRFCLALTGGLGFIIYPDGRMIMATAQTPSIFNWMQSLGDVTRRRLLKLLQKHELTVAELCSVLQLPQSTVSRHLKILTDDAWLSSRRDGTANLYRMRVRELDPQQARLWNLVREQAATDEPACQDETRLSEVLASRRSRSQAFFSTAYDRWDQLRTELFGSRMDSAAIAALLDSDLIIGDLGCGTGGVAATIAPWVKQVVAVDASAAMLDATRKRVKPFENVDVRRGELTALPLDQGELNLALLLLVLPYVDSPEAVLSEACRVVKSSGRLIIVDMVSHQRSHYREELGHTWLGFDEKQLRGWLMESGWKPQRWQPILPDPNAKGPELFVMSATKQ